MKIVSIAVDDLTWEAAQKVATAEQTTLENLVGKLVYSIAAARDNLAETSSHSPEELDRRQRLEIVRLSQQANLVLGYHPSRETTCDRPGLSRH